MFKKPRTNADPTLKKLIWDVYIGPGIKEALCPLCGTYKIYQFSNSGYESAHIVSAKFNTEPLNVFHIFPTCSSCNNECKDLCILDYLFCRGRLGALRKMINCIYRKFLEENADVIAPEDRLIWRVLDHLYGNKRFPAGGGIVNTKAIYEIAKGEQLSIISERLILLGKQIKDASLEYSLVAGSEVRPMKL